MSNLTSQSRARLMYTVAVCLFLVALLGLVSDALGGVLESGWLTTIVLPAVLGLVFITLGMRQARR
jgi:hypothetical protein